jgi:hypothetical protein
MPTLDVTNLRAIAAPTGQTSPAIVTTQVTGKSDEKAVRALVVVVSVGLFGVASIVAWKVFDSFDHPSYFKVGSDYTALAALVIAAAAVERLLEPFSRWLLPKADAENDASAKKEAAAAQGNSLTSSEDDVQAAANQAAEAVAKLDRRTNERAIFHWAIASSVALVAPVLLGAFFLRSVAAQGSSPNRFVDMIFTALAVGAGTKPLHDTIDRIQTKKDDKKSDTASSGT